MSARHGRRPHALRAPSCDCSLRDRRTVIMSIVLPLLVMPLMLFGSRTMEQRAGAQAARRHAFAVAVTGARPTAAPRSLEATARAGCRAGTAAAGSAPFRAGARGRRRGRRSTPATCASSSRPTSADEARERRRAGAATSAALERPRRPRRGPRRGRSRRRRGRAPPVLVLVSRGDRERSSPRRRRSMRERLRETRRRSARDAAGAGAASRCRWPRCAVAETDVATAGQVAGLTLGRLLTLLLLLFILSGGAVGRHRHAWPARRSAARSKRC